MHAVRLLHRWFGRPIRESRSARLLRSHIESHDRIRLALGSESHCTDGWIHAGCNQLDLVNPASWSCFFQKSSVDAMLADHVWEHLSEKEGRTAARNCFQFLRPGGYLRVAVPDGFHPSQTACEQVREESSVSRTAADCLLYNHRSFADMFLAAGFQVRLIEFFDREGAFHSNHWDVSKGLVQRTLLFDERNITQPYAYTSLVLDAFKPDAAEMGFDREARRGQEARMIGVGKTPIAAGGCDVNRGDSENEAA